MVGRKESIRCLPAIKDMLIFVGKTKDALSVFKFVGINMDITFTSSMIMEEVSFIVVGNRGTAARDSRLFVSKEFDIFYFFTVLYSF